MRNYSRCDQLISQLDTAVRTVSLRSTRSDRQYPGEHALPNDLSEQEKKQSARLMRVNHAGEIAAQGLYHGQAFTARKITVKEEMNKAAREEREHLAWCQQRLNELNGKPSYISPFWYIGSFVIGAAAGLAGDRWSLGFVVETERQVESHLTDHLDRLPVNDVKSQAILQQMRNDEIEHAQNAQRLGAAPLPKPVKAAMSAVSKIMTGGAYWI